MPSPTTNHWCAPPTRLACLLAVATACTPTVPLSDAPIFGGTEAQAARARLVAQRFDAWTGGVVDIQSISFVSAEEMGDAPSEGRHAVGRYRGARQDVLVLEDLWGEHLERVLQHEFCHALREDIGRTTVSDAILDGLSAEALADVEHPIHADILGRSDDPDSLLHEVFALACEQGPVWASLAAQPCEGDVWPTRGVAHWLATDVWKDGLLDTEAPDLASHDGHVGFPLSAGKMTFYGSHTTGHIQLMQVGELGQTDRLLDTSTGHIDAASLPRGESDTFGDVPPELPFGVLEPWVSTVSPVAPGESLAVDGEHVVLARLDPDGLSEGMSPRVLSWVDGAWAKTTECVAEDAGLARVRESEVWLVEVLGLQELRWRRIR